MTTKSQLWFNSASLPSPLTLLSFPQCLHFGRHPWRTDKLSLVHLSIPFCHSTVLRKHFVTTTASVCYCHAAAIPHHLPKQGALWSSSGIAVSMCQAWMHPESPLISARSSCAHINSFLRSFNLEPPGGTGCPHLAFYTSQNGKGHPPSPVTTVKDKAPTLTQSPLADVCPGGTANDELRVTH